MYNGNSRLDQLPGGTITELIATSVEMGYDPNTQTATAVFRAPRFIPDGDTGQFLQLSGLQDTLLVDATSKASDILGVGLVDPVTGRTCEGLSALMIPLLLKEAYNKWHNDAYRALHPAPAEPDPETPPAEGEGGGETTPPEEPTP